METNLHTALDMCVTAMPSEATGSNVLINQQIIFDRDVWLDSLSINVWGTAAHHLLAIVVRGPHHRSAMTANSVDDGSAADGSSAFAYALPFTGFAKGSGAFVAKDHSLIFQVSAKMWCIPGCRPHFLLRGGVFALEGCRICTLSLTRYITSASLTALRPRRSALRSPPGRRLSRLGSRRTS